MYDLFIYFKEIRANILVVDAEVSYPKKFFWNS